MATTRKAKPKATNPNQPKKLSPSERAAMHDRLGQRPESRKALAEGDEAWARYRQAVKDR